jgi:hypothetical protein
MKGIISGNVIILVQSKSSATIVASILIATTV